MKQRNKATTAADCHAKAAGRFFSHFLYVFEKVFGIGKTTGPDPCTSEVLFFSRVAVFFFRGAVAIFSGAVAIVLGLCMHLLCYRKMSFTFL